MRELPNGMRDKIMGAAELFADFGLDATKMEDIAAATGVPKATLYYYFKSKEDILAFLFTEILDEIARTVDAAVASEGNAAQRLRATILAHLKVYQDFPAASRALQFDLGRAARIPLIDKRTDAAFLGPVRKLLQEGAKDGSLRDIAHPRLAAVAILGAVTTVGINAIAPGATRRIDEVADDVVDFVMQGVSA